MLSPNPMVATAAGKSRAAARKQSQTDQKPLARATNARAFSILIRRLPFTRRPPSSRRPSERCAHVLVRLNRRSLHATPSAADAGTGVFICPVGAGAGDHAGHREHRHGCPLPRGGQRLASVQLRDAPAPAEFSSRIGAFASSRRTRRGGSIRACWRIWR